MEFLPSFHDSLAVPILVALLSVGQPQQVPSCLPRPIDPTEMHLPGQQRQRGWP